MSWRAKTCGKKIKPDKSLRSRNLTHARVYDASFQFIQHQSTTTRSKSYLSTQQLVPKTPSSEKGFLDDVSRAEQSQVAAQFSDQEHDDEVKKIHTRRKTQYRPTRLRVKHEGCSKAVLEKEPLSAARYKSALGTDKLRNRPPCRPPCARNLNVQAPRDQAQKTWITDRGIDDVCLALLVSSKEIGMARVGAGAVACPSRAKLG